jgi:mono/diheme cytochrome c family protein
MHARDPVRPIVFFLASLTLLSSGAVPAAAEGGGVQLATGRVIYDEHCADCHGAGGGGDGPTARRIGFNPRDFAQGVFKCRCTSVTDLPSDADLVRSVTDGLDGSAMIGFGDVLSTEEIAAVVAVVKSFSSRFQAASAAPAPDCLEPPEPPPADAALAAEGVQVYRALQCWQCHGAGGEGDGPLSKVLKDEWGDPIKPRRFSRPKYKCGAGERDLYRTIHVGLAGTPMAPYAGSLLYAKETADGVGNFRSAIGAPAVEELRDHLAAQPDAAALAAMSEDERRALVERRTWALVRHVRSLGEAGK